MATRNFAPSLSILALAGSADAAKHAAFADMARGVLSFVAHGTRNVLTDTREALQTLKGAQAKRVLAMIESAYADADATFEANPRAPGMKGAEREACVKTLVAAIVARAVAEYDAAETAAATAKAAKAAESKAKAEKAKKLAEKALKDAAKSVEPAARALTLADALDMVRAACIAGDETTQSAVIGICETFAEVAVN